LTGQYFSPGCGRTRSMLLARMGAGKTITWS
jgi:hypothetical protein